MQKQLSIVLVVLGGIAIVLGYLVFQQQEVFSLDSTKEVSSQLEKEEYPSYTSLDEILNFPGDDVPLDVKQLHFELAQSIAEEAKVLEMGTDCVMNPVVLQVQQGEILRVDNTDTIQHELVVSPEYIYLVPAGQSKQLTVDFGKGPGLYGYSCDQHTVPTGIFLITE